MANYGAAPYEEAAAKGQARMTLLQRIGQAFAGAGYGVAASQNAQNPFEAGALGFAGAFGHANAARQAAEEYARKKIEAQNAQEFRSLQMKNMESEIEARAKAKPESVDSKQRDYRTLIGQGLSPIDARQVVYGATLSEQAKQKAEGAAAADQSPNLDEEALNIAADMYINTGMLPSFGMGKSGLASRVKILDRAAQRHPGANVALNRAELQTGTKSLASLKLLYNQSTAFEKTAIANADVMMEAVRGIPETGNQFGNRVLRYLAQKSGSPAVSRFYTALETVKPEFARLLTTAGAGGTMLTDTARKDMEHVLGGDFTKAQLARSLEVLKRDAANKRTSYKSQIDEITSGIAPRTGGNQDIGGGADLIWNPATGELEPAQ